MLIIYASKTNEDAGTKQLKTSAKTKCNELETGHSNKTLGHVNTRGSSASENELLSNFYLLL